MDIAAQRKIVAILKVLQENDRPMGSAAISRLLSQAGIDLQERMIRNYLSLTDREGLTENLGRRGRVLTDRGRRELDVAVAIDNIGFVAARVDELSYRMTFDETDLAGTIIVNISTIDNKHYRRALEEIAAVIGARLGTGHFLSVIPQNQHLQDIHIGDDQFAIATVCSVVLNGVLLRHGISMTSRFGGLLELYEGIPLRFKQIINYDGSTLDPIEIFIKSGMTSVRQATATGAGAIGASFREIPSATLPAVKTIITRLDEIGLGGVLMIGKPSQPLLDIPVGQGRVGLIIAGGLNPIAALEEVGIPTTSHALHCLWDFQQLQTVETCRNRNP